MIPGIVASAQMSAAGAPPVGDDFFASDGSTQPIHGSASYPAATYHSGSTTTWFAWEAWDGAHRFVQVTAYNHTSQTWRPNIAVYGQPLVDDGHGGPALAVDADGYVHLFIGGHDSDMYHWSTTLPGDHSDWAIRATFSGQYSYPHPVAVGSAIYLFMRREIGATTVRELVRYKTTALTAGVPTWGSEQSVVNWGTDSRVYAGPMVLTGTDIHFCATFADDADSVRRDIYHFIYDTTDESLVTADGGTSVAVGSQPADLTESADFLVVDQSTNETDLPGFCLDSTGAPCLAYPDGTGTSYDLEFTRFSGGSWSAPVTIGALVGTDHGEFTDSIALVPLADGDLEVWYPKDTGSFTLGGDMVRRISTDNGATWGSESTILAAGAGPALARASMVRNGHANARVVFCETAQTQDDADAGDLKMYAHGDNGFLDRATSAPTAIVLSSETVVETAGVGDLVAILHATGDPDPGDTFTFAITSDPDSKFAIDGNRLELAATVSEPNTHNVTIRVTDSFAHTFSDTFTITAVAAETDVEDAFYADVALVLDTTLPVAVGTDASITNVVLLLDGST